MSLTAWTYKLGPDNASLVVKTYREGVAAKAGHDLIIDVTQWGATLELGERGSPSSLELDADERSLHVREGLGGLKALGDKDRDEIHRNIDEKVLGAASIYFRSSAVEASGGDRLSVRGALTMHGQPVRRASSSVRVPTVASAGPLSWSRASRGSSPTAA